MDKATVTVTVNFLDSVKFTIPYDEETDDINEEILFDKIRGKFSNIGIGDTLTLSIDEFDVVTCENRDWKHTTIYPINRFN